LPTLFLLGIVLKQFEGTHQHFRLLGSPSQFFQIAAFPGSTTTTDFLWIYPFDDTCKEQAWQYPTTV
jgi:hypothetical protein